jgi:hypothetical protein
MELVIGTIVLVVVLLVLASVRVSRIASWRAVAAVAAATGSLRAGVEFIRYCERL